MEPTFDGHTEKMYVTTVARLHTLRVSVLNQCAPQGEKLARPQPGPNRIRETRACHA